MSDTTHDDDTAGEQSEQTIERDITTQYGSGEDEITLVHDTENEQAWIQSDHTVDVTE